MPPESWLRPGPSLGTVARASPALSREDRDGGKSGGLAGTGSGVPLPMMLPCWGGRRAVAQGVTFWDL